MSNLPSIKDRIAWTPCCAEGDESPTYHWAESRCEHLTPGWKNPLMMCGKVRSHDEHPWDRKHGRSGAPHCEECWDLQMKSWDGIDEKLER